MRDYMKIYRCMIVMVLAIHAQSNFLYSASRESTADAITKEHKNEKVQMLIRQLSQGLESSEDKVCENIAILSQIGQLIKDGADGNTTDEHGRTALHWAALHGHFELVTILINCNAKVDQKDNVERTPLYYASKHGNADIVQKFLENNADVDATDEDNETSLHCAAQGGHCEVMRMLIGNRANVNAANEDGKTPLHLAASQGNCCTVEILLNQGAHVNASDKVHRTPRHNVLSQLTNHNISNQASRFDSINDANERIVAMRETVHAATEAKERERFQICRYMLEHPDQINSIFSMRRTKSANNCSKFKIN